MTRLLEALNAAAILPSVVLLILLGRYFSKEAVRRGLHSLDWFHLPPSMNLALAMFIFDVGVTMRLGATVIWYLLGEKILPLVAIFGIAITVIITGLLCKIRALTEPEYGRWPWFIIGAITSLIMLLVAAMSPVQAQNARRLVLSGGVPSWVKSGASVDLDFANGRTFGCTLAQCLSITRASTKTNLLPSSASGFAYTTFGNNTLAVTAGSGALLERFSRTNQLLNSTIPATQTTGSLAASAQTLWVNGSGSATLSNGTATNCTGTATQGAPITFTPTAGTCTVTVTGSLNAFQLEAGAFGSSFIVTAGAPATRASDNVTAVVPLALATAQAITARFKVNLGENPAPTLSYFMINGFSSDRYYFASNTTTQVISNGTTVATATLGSGNSQGTVASVISWGAAGTTNVANLGTEASNGAKRATDNSAMQIGGDGYYLQRLTFWNSVLPASTRLSLSDPTQ